MLIGHTTTRTTLNTLLAGGKMPHALLLCGPQGIGKATLATHLAARLVCGAGQGPADDTNPFNANMLSPQMAQLAAGSCPDFHHLTPPEKRKTIGVESVRELLATLKRTADTHRVVIIDSTDALTPEAANTLLKSLEEPRPGIFFILIAHSLAQVLPTIRSRCRLVRMSPLSVAETRTVLTHLGQNPSLAEGAHGSAGQALQSANPLQTLLATLAQNPGYAAANAYQKLDKLSRLATQLNLPQEETFRHAQNLADKALADAGR